MIAVFGRRFAALRARLVCRTYGARISIFQLTHTFGFAYARLQCGLTCGRAYGAWTMVNTIKGLGYRETAAEPIPRLRATTLEDHDCLVRQARDSMWFGSALGNRQSAFKPIKP